MGDISRNFSRFEMACHCCGKGEVMPELVDALQELRDAVNRPITIISGYRCPKHNREVGGVQDSFHTKGMAADIRVKGMAVPQMAAEAEKIQVFREGGIGKYYDKNFVHVDIRSWCARWTKYFG